MATLAGADRTTEFAFVQLHEKATTRVTGDFLRALIQAAPYRIHTVLTDNGIHFTDPRSPGFAVFAIKQAIAVSEIFRAHTLKYFCAENDIEHWLGEDPHLPYGILTSAMWKVLVLGKPSRHAWMCFGLQQWVWLKFDDVCRWLGAIRWETTP